MADEARERSFPKLEKMGVTWSFKYSEIGVLKTNHTTIVSFCEKLVLKIWHNSKKCLIIHGRPKGEGEGEGEEEYPTKPKKLLYENGLFSKAA